VKPDTQGRSFVRLEEAVAGELGQLRVSGMFYSGVIRLIRRGLLAIAIDGFDELLAEVGSGEAYSARSSAPGCSGTEMWKPKCVPNHRHALGSLGTRRADN
jgi:hypothetical protein